MTPAELTAQLQGVIGILLTIMTAAAVAVSLRAHERNRELTALTAELRESTERAHRVVDDVSHEFRTPLTVIKEFGSILRDGVAGSVSPSQVEYLSFIDDAATDLNHLIEDLLDSSKLRVGRLRVDRRGCDVAAIFTRVERDFSRRLSVRELTLKIVQDADLPAVFADEEKVRRVISNLMSNAAKFSPTGATIELSATRSVRSGEVVISVKDQGRGLTQAEIEGLFRRFQQRATPKDRSAKGFGLGLVIAEELSRLNLGKLSVRSDAGHGALFSFTLPTADLHGVLGHFFETALRLPAEDGVLALLAVEALPSEGVDGRQAISAPDEEIPVSREPGAFLTAMTHPADLVLDSWRDLALPLEKVIASGGPRTWFLLGRTASVEGWVSRLQRARREQQAAQATPLCSLDIRVVALWRYPRDAEFAQTEVTHLLETTTLEATRHAPAFATT